MKQSEIKTNRIYGNDKGATRQLLEFQCYPAKMDVTKPGRYVFYKQLTGYRYGAYMVITLRSFAKWAKKEVPSLSSLRGMAPEMTGELDSVSFVRKQREAGKP